MNVEENDTTNGEDYTTINVELYPDNEINRNEINRKGYGINNMTIKMNNLPYSDKDTVDYFLKNLRDYISWITTRKRESDMSLEDQTKDHNHFFKSNKIEYKLVPINPSTGGRKKRKSMKRKSRKNKKNKKKTSKHRGGNADADAAEEIDIKQYIAGTIEQQLVDHFDRAINMYPQYCDYAIELIVSDNKMSDDDKKEFINSCVDAINKSYSITDAKQIFDSIKIKYPDYFGNDAIEPEY